MRWREPSAPAEHHGEHFTFQLIFPRTCTYYWGFYTTCKYSIVASYISCYWFVMKSKRRLPSEMWKTPVTPCEYFWLTAVCVAPPFNVEILIKWAETWLSPVVLSVLRLGLWQNKDRGNLGSSHFSTVNNLKITITIAVPGDDTTYFLRSQDVNIYIYIKWPSREGFVIMSGNFIFIPNNESLKKISDEKEAAVLLASKIGLKVALLPLLWFILQEEYCCFFMSCSLYCFLFPS